MLDFMVDITVLLNHVCLNDIYFNFNVNFSVGSIDVIGMARVTPTVCLENKTFHMCAQ